MSKITTHILDTSRGRPATGVTVLLEIEQEGSWRAIGKGATDSDGRLRDLMPAGQALLVGNYRLTFFTAEYFAANQTNSFYPSVTVHFYVADGAEHYHVPLLLTPFGYSTYRGS